MFEIAMEKEDPFVFVFKPSTRYKFLKPLGRGAYGYVCLALDTHTKKNVAIKRISSLNNPIILLRTLREIQLLKHFKNKENIITILNSFLPESGNFTEIFLIQESMEADLHFIIQSKQVLNSDHIRFLLFQLINGLRVIHNAGVIHRDLKPSNCLVNSRCVLKICDFGLARENCDDETEMSNYVQTRWYRAPELLFKFRKYDYKVDMWSVGCIMMEMLTRAPFLPGVSEYDQVSKIFRVFGTAPRHLIDSIPNQTIKKNILLLDVKPKANLKDIFKGLDNDTISLLSKLFEMDSDKRIGAERAILHKYFRNHEAGKMEVEKYECGINENASVAEMKSVLYEEMFELHRDELIEKSIVVEDKKWSGE